MCHVRITINSETDEPWFQTIEIPVAIPPPSGTAKTCDGSAANYCPIGVLGPPLFTHVPKSTIQTACDDFCGGTGDAVCGMEAFVGQNSCGAYSFNDCKAFLYAYITGSTLACHVGSGITCTCD